VGNSSVLVLAVAVAVAGAVELRVERLVAVSLTVRIPLHHREGTMDSATRGRSGDGPSQNFTYRKGVNSRHCSGDFRISWVSPSHASLLLPGPSGQIDRTPALHEGNIWREILDGIEKRSLERNHRRRWSSGEVGSLVKAGGIKPGRTLR
jgi:hypothetical protein